VGRAWEFLILGRQEGGTSGRKLCLTSVWSKLTGISGSFYLIWFAGVGRIGVMRILVFLVLT
jgi:hypothetical protein